MQPKEIEEPKDKVCFWPMSIYVVILQVQRLCILADKEETDEKESIVVAPDFGSDIPVNEQYLDSHFFHVVQV